MRPRNARSTHLALVVGRGVVGVDQRRLEVPVNTKGEVQPWLAAPSFSALADRDRREKIMRGQPEALLFLAQSGSGTSRGQGPSGRWVAGAIHRISRAHTDQPVSIAS